MSDENGRPPHFSRRNAFRLFGAALTGGILASAEGKTASAGYGACTQCGCGGFNGAASYPLVCQTCGHFWHVHSWRNARPTTGHCGGTQP
jgi:hypothetical protein